MTSAQHAGLTPDAWGRHPFGRQILMIANEMNRASKLFGPDDIARLRGSYERVLAMVDLTVQVNARRAVRRELLRWRDLVAEQLVATPAKATAHAAAFRALLQLHPDAWRQLPFVTGVARLEGDPT